MTHAELPSEPPSLTELLQLPEEVVVELLLNDESPLLPNQRRFLLGLAAASSPRQRGAFQPQALAEIPDGYNNPAPLERVKRVSGLSERSNEDLVDSIQALTALAYIWVLGETGRISIAAPLAELINGPVTTAWNERQKR